MRADGGSGTLSISHQMSMPDQMCTDHCTTSSADCVDSSARVHWSSCGVSRHCRAFGIPGCDAIPLHHQMTRILASNRMFSWSFVSTDLSRSRCFARMYLMMTHGSCRSRCDEREGDSVRPGHPDHSCKQGGSQRDSPTAAMPVSLHPPAGSMIQLDDLSCLQSECFQV